MTLTERLTELVRACFTGLWIESHEHEDALVEIATLCRDQNWRLAVWDIERGLSLAGQPAAATGGSDPLSAIRAVSSLAAPDSSALLVLTNFHRFLNSAEIVQALCRQIVAGKQNRTFVVILSPVVNIPVELEKLFLVIEHELPRRSQLAEIAQGVATEPGELPVGNQFDGLLDAASGLTRYEAEAAFSLSLVREGRLTPQTLWEQKAQLLKKRGLLQLHRGTENFSSLGGLTALKAFCKRSLVQTRRHDPRRRPRGVLLLSPPGCGKSQFCKALGNETGRPTLALDIGSLMGSLVGDTERNTRQALQIADAMAPCIVYCDEIEKSLSGVSGSGQGDSGVSTRLFGTLLSYLNDHDSDVYFVCTANDVSRLPPEFSRAERFDAVFFLDLPGDSERRAIWSLYLEQFGLDRNQRLPDDAQWTGAEIKACCRLASLLDLPLLQAAQNIVPVAVTSAESVERLRAWASGRCLSAAQAGIYRRAVVSSGRANRKVNRDPSNN